MANIHRLSEHMLIKSSFNAALANSSQNGVAVDTQGFRRAALIFDAVTGAATTAQVKVQECATVGGSYTDVPVSTIPATAQPASTPASGIAGAPYILNIDLETRLRFLRAVVIGTGAAGQAVADFVLYEPFNAPPAQDNTAVSV